jgi:hypothetical protein
MKKKLQEAEEGGKRQVEDAERREAAAKKEKEELDAKVTGIDLAAKSELERLQIKLAANLKLIQYLRKENKKARKSFVKEDTVLKGFGDNCQKLTDRNQESCTFFDDITETLETARDKNDRLLEEWQRAKELNMDMKDKLQKLQSKYLGTAEQRLDLQKTLALILNTVQEGCKNPSLIETAFCLGHECETEAKCIMAKVEAIELPDLFMSDSSDSTRSTSMDSSQVSLKMV